jgi:hypothetical protein
VYLTQHCSIHSETHFIDAEGNAELGEYGGSAASLIGETKGSIYYYGDNGWWIRVQSNDYKEGTGYQNFALGPTTGYAIVGDVATAIPDEGAELELSGLTHAPAVRTDNYIHWYGNVVASDSALYYVASSVLYRYDLATQAEATLSEDFPVEAGLFLDGSRLFYAGGSFASPDISAKPGEVGFYDLENGERTVIGTDAVGSVSSANGVVYWGTLDKKVRARVIGTGSR